MPKADQLVEQTKRAPISEATDPLSFVTLSWLTDMVKEGTKRPLLQSDMPQVPKSSTSAAVAAFMDPFQSKLKLYLAGHDQSAKKPTFFSDFWKRIGPTWTVSVLLDVVATFLQTTQPVVLAAILNYIMTGDSQFFITSPAALATTFFLMTFLSVIFKQIIEQMFRKMRFNVRTVLMTSIYAKALKLSNASSMEFSKGRVLQMINVDIEQVSDIVERAHLAILIPIQLAFTFYYLVKLFGRDLYPVGIVAAIFFVFAPVMLLVFGKFQTVYLAGGDKRVRYLREILEGMRMIKLRGQEAFFSKNMADIRATQLRAMRVMYIAILFFIFFVIAVPYAMIIGTFTVYSLSHEILSPAVIFPAITYFMNIFQPFQALPQICTMIGMAIISWNRIRAFMVSSESELVTEEASKNALHAIEIRNATFKWEVAAADENADKSDKSSESKGKKSEPEISQDKTEEEASSTAEVEPLFKNLNVNIPVGKLTAVVGTVGSGKSSFFSACIGEMTCLEGDVKIFGSMALCQQQPWLMSLNLRENILFGREFDQKKMDETIRVCGLEVDLEQLPQGLDTEVGEKGISLSGGQKARVALARAVYSNADTYLLDDPIAALDAHVGKHVFEECIVGALNSKTRVLITHHLHVLSQVDHVIVLDHGKVVEQGAFADLANANGPLSELLKHHTQEKEQEEEDNKKTEKKKAIVKKKVSVENQEKSADALIAEEDRQTGAVASKFFVNYFRAGGYLPFALFLFFGLMYAVFNFFTNLWLSYWSFDSTMGQTRFGLRPNDYILVYAGIVAVNFACAPHINGSSQYKSYIAAKKYHAGALDGLLSAPMSFFESQPIGRILNRLTKDIEALDLMLWNDSLNCIIVNAMLIVGIAQAVYGTLWTLIFLAFMTVLYYYMLRMYRANMREIKRLVAGAKSPLNAYISECIGGTSTIRAFQSAQVTVEKQRLLMDESIRPAWTQENVANWFQIRLQLFLSLIVLFLSFFALYGKQDAGVMGLALTGAISLTEMFMPSLIVISRTEANFVAVERLDLYCNDLPKEAPPRLDTDPSSASWPSEGRIAISNLEVKYASKAESVIKDLTVEFRGSEKVGVVGRTGSGKSTLMTALFRIVEAKNGTIAIDGVDISKIGLHTLRSRLQIIPQEPVLFTGTMRTNIDIEGSFSDQQIWEALELVGMKEYVSELPEKLDAPVSEHGENLSVGQRQLMMLASAICHRPKILVMDEASSSVDQAADLLIQASIRTHFKDTTVISIAHRVNSIADFDRIMVLDAGSLVEFDTPAALLERPGGVFKSLVDATGAANAAIVADIARRHAN
ncbi:Multidrug resistance-associated protein 1 [Chytriomyces hyalinus]|nr:Multidrug resistance-associated protein 1 [Chytriomyces hyalinus]